jgi:hypothetical protein
MVNLLNTLIDRMSEYFAARKGLLPMLAILLIILNFLLQFVPGAAPLSQLNIFLHLGVILGFFGVMLAWAL